MNQQAGNSVGLVCWSLKEEFLLQETCLFFFPLYGLQLIGWGVLTLWRVICFTLSQLTLNVNNIHNNLHSSIYSNVWLNHWALTKLTETANRCHICVNYYGIKSSSEGLIIFVKAFKLNISFIFWFHRSVLSVYYIDVYNLTF